MKNRTSEVARTLSMHPAAILLGAASIDSKLTFDDVWPEIDQKLLDTMSLSPNLDTMRDVRLPAGAYLRAVVTKESLHGIARAPDVRSSSSSVSIANKLYQQRKWGGTSVPFETLVNTTHLPPNEVEKAIIELRDKKFLDSDAMERGEYSLNSSKRREIELFIKHKVRA
jgi:hypothetical protein